MGEGLARSSVVDDCNKEVTCWSGQGTRLPLEEEASGSNPGWSDSAGMMRQELSLPKTRCGFGIECCWRVGGRRAFCMRGSSVFGVWGQEDFLHEGFECFLKMRICVSCNTKKSKTEMTASFQENKSKHTRG